MNFYKYKVLTKFMGTEKTVFWKQFPQVKLSLWNAKKLLSTY